MKRSRSRESAAKGQGRRFERSPPKHELFWWIWFRLVSSAIVSSAYLVHRSCKVEIEEDPEASHDGNVIYCLWHGDLFAYFMAFWGSHGLVWMGSPSWKITHLKLTLLRVGVKKWIPGTTGDGGREALEKVVELLGEGYSTLMTPDGPRGPSKTLRKGVIHMARQSGVPIVAVNFDARKKLVAEGQWDRKWSPRPFSTLRVRLHPPIFVTPENEDEATKMLAEYLG